MKNFVHWLFGIEQSPDWIAGGRWHLELDALPRGLGSAALIAAAIAVVVGVWWLYRLEGRQLSRFARGTLALMRCLMLTCVVLMLTEAVLVFTKHEQLPSRLLVLVDTSQSMSLADPYSNKQTAERVAMKTGVKDRAGRPDIAALRKRSRLDLVRAGLAPLMSKLGRGREIHIYSFSEKLQRADSFGALQQLKPTGGASALGDAIKNALAAHRGQPIAGMLLVTDAQSNAGEDPRKVSAMASSQRVLINALAAGTEQGPSNARMADLEASPVVFERDPSEVAAVVQSQGMEGQTATVSLEKRPDGGNWTEIGRQDVVLGEDRMIKRVTFDLANDALGTFDLRARVADAGTELTTADNELVKSMKVVRQRIRVLLVAGGPSPEMQFMRNAMMRDTRIEFSSWLQSAGDRYENVGHRPLRRLPSSRKELDEYDAVILFDPDVRKLSPIWPELLTKFVGDAGGGVVYVAGEQYSAPLFAGTDNDRSIDNTWLRILPVANDAGLYRTGASVSLNPHDTWTFELTGEGSSDPIFRFSPDPNRNRDILTSLPGMYWHFPVTRAKPGATVLARHGDPRMRNSYGRHVLMAMQRYGPGRTVFLGFDSTYRWRFLHEEYFDGFWARLVDRVGRDKALGGRYPFSLSTDKATYHTGDRVVVSARLIGGEETMNLSDLHGDLEMPGQATATVNFDPLPQDPSVMEGSFSASDPGTYVLRVVPAGAGAEGDASVRAATLSFRVEPPRQEIDQPKLNRALLEDVTRATGGSMFTLADVDRLPDAFKIHQVDRVLEYRDETWDAPILFGGFVCLVTLEWVLRKRYRMA